MEETKLSSSLQENLLALLSFSDNSFNLIRTSVDQKLFASSVYRDIVGRVYEYIDQFHAPPKDHLPDLFDDIIDSAADIDRDRYIDVISAVYKLHGNVNEKFIMSRLAAFVKEQNLKLGIMRATEHIQSNDMEQAELELEHALRTRLSLFSPGTTLREGAINSLTSARDGIISTGIDALDRYECGPGNGELHVFMAPPKRGKTWWLVHMAKRCLLQRKKIVYITLEISERLIIQRILQSLFSLPRRDGKIAVVQFVEDDLGRLVNLKKDRLVRPITLSSPKVTKFVTDKLDKLHFTDNLVVKEFPTGQLTVNGLAAYLDALERSTKFIPDVIIVDYPDLMKIDGANVRTDTGIVYKDLRGRIAVERNVPVIVVTQSNRTGAGAKLVSDIHASEDFSKIATADTIYTFSQTKIEKECGLARVFVSNSRVADRDGFIVLLSQAYPIGQFAMYSTLMENSYWDYLEKYSGMPQDLQDVP